MSQTDILKHLEKHQDTWFSAKQLSERLKLSRKAVECSLVALRRTSFINCVKEDGRKYIYKYRKNIEGD